MAQDFKLDTTFSGSGKSYARPAGIVGAVLGLVLIVLTLATNIPAQWLPMNENYLAVLIPKASDGAQPLSLKKVEHKEAGDAVMISGEVENRTDMDVADLRAQIVTVDRFGLNPMTIEVPLEPAVLAAHATATFEAALTGKPYSFTVKFRLEDGPFVPHKDDRPPAPPTPPAKSK